MRPLEYMVPHMTLFYGAELSDCFLILKKTFPILKRYYVQKSKILYVCDLSEKRFRKTRLFGNLSAINHQENGITKIIGGKCVLAPRKVSEVFQKNVDRKNAISG